MSELLLELFEAVFSSFETFLKVSDFVPLIRGGSQVFRSINTLFGRFTLYFWLFSEVELRQTDE